jgi:hypothetical protein
MAAPDTPLMAEARAAVAQAKSVDVMDAHALCKTVARLQAVLERVIEVVEGGESR